jgi:hypothetical protein
LFTLLLPGDLVARLQDTSPRIQITQLDALEREGRIYELKESARAAAEQEPQNPAVLGHLARINDVFGDHAAEAYERWADALVRSGASQPTIRQTLERGVLVALRDGDQERAQRLAGRLSPDSRFSRLSNVDQVAPSAPGLTIPGGTAALARVVEMEGSVPASRFMAEYARAILRRGNQTPASRKPFEDRLKRYFDVVRTLLSYGRPGSDETEIVLDSTNPNGIDRTSRILATIGWRFRAVPGGAVLVELAAGAENGERQQIGSAVGIDEADMKLTLEAKKPFALRLRHERVPTVLDPSFWEKLTANPVTPSRGLMEDMIYDPRVAGLYVALSNMNDETRQAVLAAFPTEELLLWTRQLSFYGSSLSIERGRLVLPGGAEATDPWTKLVVADPTQIRLFIRNLTKKDGGKLFAFYHALSGLPLQNQRFFARSASRLSRFYKAFPFSDERALGRGLFLHKEDQFARLAREIPLDANGNVRFPGSDRVWMVTKTDASENIADLQTLLERASRVRTRDAEDEILLDMLEREYENDLHQKFRRIQAFLAAVRIDAHRLQPMDETMALVLAQKYGNYESMFPYFSEVTELTGAQAFSLFQAAKRLETFSGVELNTALGEFHSLLKLVSLLHEVKAIPDAKAAELFSGICNSFARISTAREVARASFDRIEAILHEINGTPGGDADKRLAQAFAGQDKSMQFMFQGLSRSVNLAEANKHRMREVLRLQGIVPLEVLVQGYRAALKWTDGIDAQSLAQIEGSLPDIVEIAPTGRNKLPKDVAEMVLIGRPAELASLVQKLRKQVEATKTSSKDVAKLADDFISELSPFLKTTLTGWIYAYYLSPTDLAVASNPYFTRSHIFGDSKIGGYWPKAGLEESPVGSRIRGGFAQIGFALSGVAATAMDPSISVSPYHAAAMQLTAVRSVPWNVVEARTIHLAALRVRLGREFIVQAALSDPLRDLLENATLGALGQARRHEMLNAVSIRDVSHAVSLLTASDLFFLADSFISTSADRGNSEVLVSAYTRELQLVPLQQIDYFGGIHTETAGCTHPHLVNSPPYEDYAEHFSPTPLAERMSDILLEVVESADRIALPVEAVGLLAESAVREFFRQTRSTPREDWRSAAHAMRAIDMSTFDMLERR